jgi:hypothetical protein
MSFRPTTLMQAATATAWVATSVACGGGAAPDFEDPCANAADCRPQVGVEFTLELRATDADGDRLEYSFQTDVPDIMDRASITRSPTGYGLFKWTPLASDVQEWSFDFTASDGGNDTTVTVPLDVRSAIGSETAPVFRRPLGTGTTLDTTATECLDVEIIVDDQDNPQDVTIAQDEPLIEGATLEQTSNTMASWHWCPTREQADADDRYTLTLSADDTQNPKTLKNYLVVLKGGSGSNCPGGAPAISHAPQNEDTVVDLTIPADVSDDQGLKAPPLFYFSTTNPGTSPNLGAMTQVSMILITGNMQSGEWAADVPNPAGAGETVTLYYVIVASDDDDTMGNCDHRTESQVYSITVHNPGGAGNTGLCESCSNDNQCGNDGDLCVTVAAGQQSYCLQACDGPGQCPTGYTCSAAPVTSVDGASGRQCIPNTGSCTMSEVCIDDTYEDNDSRAQATTNPSLPPEFYELTSCPTSGGFDDDEDWFKIDISQSSRVDITLYGEDTSDLDVGLYDNTGARISSSTSLESDEQITKCVPTGTYFIRAYAWSAAPNDYLLEWTRANETCDTSCIDDSDEDDDTASQARDATFTPYDSFDNRICTNDDDRYRVHLFTGDRLVVDLSFIQSSFDEDLDLHLLDEFDFDLTPCSEAEPELCTSAQGQSADSNEHYEYLVPSTDGCSGGCDYFVIVRGWDGSTNDYDISIDVQ